MVRFERVYLKIVRFLVRWKVIVLVVGILGFGLPIHMLPKELKQKNWWGETYNATLGSEFYREHLKKPINMALGGTLRLFLQVYGSGSYFSEKEQTQLYVRGYMPRGANTHQLNELVLQLESNLQQYPQINQFQSRVNGLQTNITITFKEKYEFGNFPFYLKEVLTSAVIDLGSAEWTVSGVGDGFNNIFKERTGSYKINLEGYDYERIITHSSRTER